MQTTSTKYQLTVSGKSVNFICRSDEDFNEALSRGAAKLGYLGGAFTQENFSLNRQVTVTDRPSGNTDARAAYTGMCVEL